MIKIGLDAGHGGADPGAVYGERKEADDVLALGKAIAGKLRSHGIIVGETRTKDISVPLSKRARLSNERAYDYFISIHRNAYLPEMASGVETFIHPRASDKAVSLARAIQESLVEVGFVDRGVKQANFQVLRETKAPAVLVEVGFIDHSADNWLFDAKREKIVHAITNAILGQLGKKLKEQDEMKIESAIALLVEVGIIETPEYWETCINRNVPPRSDYVALLLERMANFVQTNLN